MLPTKSGAQAGTSRAVKKVDGAESADGYRDTDGRLTYILVVDAQHREKVAQFVASIPRASCQAVPSAPACGGRAQNVQMTKRLEQVLRMVGQGMPNKLIGRELGISHLTVRNHVSRLLRLYAVSNRDELVALSNSAGMK